MAVNETKDKKTVKMSLRYVTDSTLYTYRSQNHVVRYGTNPINWNERFKQVNEISACLFFHKKWLNADSLKLSCLFELTDQDTTFCSFSREVFKLNLSVKFTLNFTHKTDEAMSVISVFQVKFNVKFTRHFSSTAWIKINSITFGETKRFVIL